MRRFQPLYLTLNTNTLDWNFVSRCYVHYPYDYVVLKEVRFLREKLSKRWTPNPYWTELAIAAYGSEGAHIYGNFKYETVEDYEHDLENLTNHYPLGSPSFQRGTKEVLTLLVDHHRFGHNNAYVLFTYTSWQKRLIIVGVGSKFNSSIVSATLGQSSIVANVYDDALADKIFGEICDGLPLMPTEPPKPGLGCDVDVMFAMDLSIATPQETYQREIAFIRNQLAPTWNIYPWATEVIIDVHHGIVSTTTGEFNCKGNDEFYTTLEKLSQDRPWGSPNIKRSVSDVEEAVINARWLFEGGDKLIIVTPLKENVKMFSMLSNETFYIANFDSNDALQISSAICGPLPPLPTLPTTTPTPKPTTAPAPGITTTLRPLPTLPPQLPCSVSVITMLDASTAVSKEEYEKEVRFLREKLAKRWSPSPHWTQMAAGAYGGSGTVLLGDFKYESVEDYERDLKNLSNAYPLGPPSLTRYFIF
ncbi:unnamed protein product [Toxocara canis]|uniref:VWFA domain-containing protein n=1 Tax=Toxocara canis TaxID=6265 RepID=A0A183V9I6_TOXCA|nr:unnamed protein product [Toxocara canis]